MPDPISLEACRKSARRLRKAFLAGDAEARGRVAAHVDVGKAPRHADFLHVIACEAGHASWPKLKFAIESAAETRAEKRERLRRALFHGQHWITDSLLKAEPDLALGDFGLEVALLDKDAVGAVLQRDPDAAARKLGARTPILHLAFSKEIHRSPEKQSDMMAIAELLVAHGADVNDGFPYQSGDTDLLSALYGALCHADNLVLGGWLLDQGADPNDNESLYHATELGHTRALELLLAHGARPEGTNALLRALDFEDMSKVRMLLEAGADPNVTVPDLPASLPRNQIPALHHAIRRGRGAGAIDLLLGFAADPAALWSGHTPYALARIHGNRDAADHLAALGHATGLSANETVLAACADLDPDPGRLDKFALADHDLDLLTELAALPERSAHLATLVGAGLDPERADHMGLTPLHLAGWHGSVPELRYFLSLGGDLERRNGYGGDALDTVVHGSEFAPARPDADHIACARLLLEAGSVLRQGFIDGSGNPEMVAFLEAWQEEHP